MDSRTNEKPTWARAWETLPASRFRSVAGHTVPLPYRHREERDGFRVVVDIDVVDGRLDCVMLEVTSAVGKPVTGQALRHFPIGQYVDNAVAEVADWADGAYAAPKDFPQCGPTDEALAFVAHVYALHGALGRKPTVAVMELGLPRSTASLWIKKAREKGLL